MTSIIIISHMIALTLMSDTLINETKKSHQNGKEIFYINSWLNAIIIVQYVYKMLHIIFYINF